MIFDLDGTLYRLAPVRVLMSLELLTLPLMAPWHAPRRWRALQAYRRAQEALRLSPSGTSTAAQLEIAAAASGLSAADTERLVHEWMQRRPLKYLRWCRARGLMKLLDLLDHAGVRTGVLSDYPPQAKLEALGLGGRFLPALCSTDPAIGALKPSPRGFLHTAALWGLPAADVLVVGDRADVDGAGAEAAGMRCVIISAPPRSRPRTPNLAYSSLERLCDALTDRG